MRTLSRGALLIATTLCAVVAYELGHADTLPGSATEVETRIEVQGWVLSLDGGDVVIDLGTKAGAATGDVVDLWRPIKVKHPITGKIITDRYLIGRVRITQARDVVSLAHADGTLLRDVAVSDVVILRKLAPIVVPKAKSSPTIPTPASTGTSTGPIPTAVATGTKPLVIPTPVDGPKSDPETEALSLVLQELEGTPPETRVIRYEGFVRKWPEGRFAKVLTEEAAALRRPTGKRATTEATSRSFARPTELLVDIPLTFGIEVDGRIVGAVLYVRGAEETGFTPFPMKPSGPGYFRVVAPITKLRPPFVSYFVEAVFADGKTTPIEGSPSSPYRLAIVNPKATVVTGYERTFSAWSDYADYNRLLRNDYAWQTEGYFGLRFGDIGLPLGGDVGLRAVRSGFGVYKGVGGSIVELDTEKRSPRAVGLTYGYIETELGLSNFWGLVGRVVLGLGKEGVTGGVQGFVRIGNDKRTNMLLGGEFLGGVGVRGITQFELNVFPKIPIGLRVEVTNQPAGTSSTYLASGSTTATGVADIGVRFVGQVGYRFTPSFTAHLRGSYQMRNIYHAGPGFGGGATFAW